MAIVKNEKKIVISKNALCAKGNMVTDIIQKSVEGQPDGYAQIKSVIGSSKMSGKWPVYLEEEAKPNLYGFIDSIEDLDDDDISMLVFDGNYDIHLNATHDKVMEGTFIILMEEGGATASSDSALAAELKELAAEVVSKGFVSQEDMDARLAVMKENYVDELLQIRVLKKYRLYHKPVHTPSCIFKDPYLEDSRKQKKEGIISEGLRAAMSGHAVILEGEKSVGKNVYAETVTWLLGKPMYLITFSRQMSPSSVYGEKTTDNSAAEELSHFDSDILMKADAVEEKKKYMLNVLLRSGKKANEAMEMAEAELTESDKDILKQAARFKMLQAQSASVNIVIDQSELYDWLVDGGVIVFNEMNMAEANFFASFTNQLLDGTGFLFIPGRGEVTIHPDCVLFGTQNADCATCSATNL